ncbi:MAG: DUF2207 domain-containing protein [Ilumatobacteraceae bacterium]|nr:DUF2207 domain-containing protein [Ilumatobacteraceae bacterium]
MPGANLTTPHIAAILDRPTTGALTVAILVGAIGWALHAYAYWSKRPRLLEPVGTKRPDPLDDGTLEPPAVVALLTNGYDVPRSAVTATALDLAARGWIRLTTSDGELVVVTRGAAQAGDTLQPFEQQVLNHLAARAFNDVTSAGTLAASHHRLDRRWWQRFRRSVATCANDLGLSHRRYSTLELAPPAVCAAIALIALWMSVRGGTEIAISDSWKSRALWFVVLGGVALLAWQTLERLLGSSQTPTDAGLQRTARWMGHRRRLRERIPEHASVLASPAQQVALAHGAVMGVSEQVLDQLPAAPEDHRRAWSEAGGTPHVVAVRYPLRPGYGQHPLRVGLAGVVVFFLFRWIRGFLGRVADGEALESLLERVPGQIELIERIAEVLAVLCWVPILWGVWAMIAGAVDSIATRERVGAIVRARRPVEVVPPLLSSVVKPFAERDRFSTYLAVDDGRRPLVTAWLANERSAAPQGAQARVRATPLLGYVRSSEPIGTATRTDD